jgi:hypothetical protein
MTGESSEKYASPSSDSRLEAGRGGIWGLEPTPRRILSAADFIPTTGRDAIAARNPPSLRSELLASL